MEFNGLELKVLREEEIKYSTPRLNSTERIKLIYNDTSYCPGCKSMSAGIYVVNKVRESFFQAGGTYGKQMVYELIRDRKGSKYIFPINTKAIDKAIEIGLIHKI